MNQASRKSVANKYTPFSLSRCIAGHDFGRDNSIYRCNSLAASKHPFSPAKREREGSSNVVPPISWHPLSLSPSLLSREQMLGNGTKLVEEDENRISFEAAKGKEKDWEAPGRSCWLFKFSAAEGRWLWSRQSAGRHWIGMNAHTFWKCHFLRLCSAVTVQIIDKDSFSRFSSPPWQDSRHLFLYEKKLGMCSVRRKEASFRFFPLTILCSPGKEWVLSLRRYFLLCCVNFTLLFLSFTSTVLMTMI